MQTAVNTNIKLFRLLLGRTLEEFVEPLGVSKALISRVENGKIPGADLIAKICSAYGIKPDRIYADEFLAILQGQSGLSQLGTSEEPTEP
jgi:transcriptional regulator with XRE-family HTH domain